MSTDENAALRLLHVVPSLQIGGMERQVANMVMASHAQQTQIHCLQRSGKFAGSLQQHGRTVLAPAGAETGGLAVLMKLVLHVRRFNPDVIHCHNLLALFYGYLAHVVTRRGAVVFSKHGNVFPRKHWNQRLALRFMRHTYNIAVSAEIADRMKALPGVRDDTVFIVPNGVVIPALERGNRPPRALRVGTVGRLVSVKRYDLLIRAFSRLRSSGLDVELVIAGDGPERESLERLCSELQITDRVRFLGDVEDLQPVYTNLDVFALTSDTEGLPMALLEAMSYGLAVTSTDVGAIPSLFADDEELLISKKGCEKSIERQLQR